MDEDSSETSRRLRAGREDMVFSADFRVSTEE
jgi:hypothetical protein